MISIRERKYIKSLQIKKYRQQHQAFLVEGWKSVKELINSNFQIELLFVSEKFEDECNGRVVDSREINEVSSLSNNNDAIAVVKIPPQKTQLENNRPFFIFDGIQDPGNLGTIVRTADWMDFPNIICSKDSVDFFNPKVIMASKGSFLRIIPHYKNLKDFIVNNMDKSVFLADLDGKDFRKAELDSNSIVIFGGESKGIRPDIRELVKQKISIPKRGGAESLNVAMSFGIIASNI